MISQKRKILIICSFVMLSMLYVNIFAVESFKPKYGIVTVNSLNLRSKPNGSIITKLSKNQNIKLIGQIDNNYIVQTNNNILGYVSKNYIELLKKSKTIGKVFTRFKPYTGYVNNSNVNLRQGPSTKFKSISKLSKNTKITIIGKIDDFYITILDNNIIGAINDKLVSINYLNNNNNNNNIITNNSNNLINTILNLINNARKEKDLKILKLDNNLNKIALLKSNEMNNKEYFNNTSPSFGTPFKMMQNFGITYLSAGENIARNSNITTAVNKWISSPIDSKNIFNSNYTNIGIGITKSKEYGYIISVMFIQK